jgi:hypothetical protein
MCAGYDGANEFDGPTAPSAPASAPGPREDTSPGEFLHALHEHKEFQEMCADDSEH